VTTEPGFAETARTIARVYDLGHTPEWSDALTFTDESGDRRSRAWLRPQDQGDLVLRRRYIETVARQTAGLFGRTPDYVALFLLGMLDRSDEFAEDQPLLRGNIDRYWDYARSQDLALAHAFIDVQVDPTRQLADTPTIRIVSRRSDGIVVRGIKSVATFAPHADECLVGANPVAKLTRDYVLYFAIPISTPGLKVIARSTTLNQASGSPLLAFGDENDALVVFDDVFVPWERVFGLGDVQIASTVFPHATDWAHWAILTRLAAKIEMLVGIFALVPELLGRSETPLAQEAVGEVLRYMHTIEALLLTSESHSHMTPGGYCVPDRTYVTTGRAYGAEHYRRIIGYLHELASQALIAFPSHAMLDHPVIGKTLDNAYASPGFDAGRKARVIQLAQELATSAYAGRQILFELFNAMPWTIQRKAITEAADLAPYKQFALAVAGLGDLDTAVGGLAQLP
jgi:4-hydroxyphenylacetate 3-monooxygenase